VAARIKPSPCTRQLQGGTTAGTAKKTVEDPNASESEVHDAELAIKVAELEKALERQTVWSAIPSGAAARRAAPTRSRSGSPTAKGM